ncbi:hypothetical protein HDV02_006344, partial [Globomyces sp. JEL0801]
ELFFTTYPLMPGLLDLPMELLLLIAQSVDALPLSMCSKQFIALRPYIIGARMKLSLHGNIPTLILENMKCIEVRCQIAQLEPESFQLASLSVFTKLEELTLIEKGISDLTGLGT